ncbi:Ig-like domain-containing protein [Neobacillus mesonae]|uniref:Ig-like domain-containing protein n=1 Tax=Neobacillus mesonae TaxID=1193713 RepID=UPI00203CB6DD|nr:Ig-like domain-containing protein [Neobacillus mesonae]MCM3567380.1 Ig-like domain-containing protein [Neobacillus mesonae]
MMAKRLSIGLVVLFLVMISFPQVQKAEASTNKQLIIINKKSNKLAFYDNGKLVKTYAVATGKTSRLTPEGTFYIRKKVKNRPWYKGHIPGGSPRNPLGKRWMELSKQENGGYPYGIHGNNNESSIGKHVSGGCIRMHNWEIEKLFDKIKVGAKVKITSSTKTFNQLAKPFFKNVDTKAPAVPSVISVSDQSKNVSGKTEAKAMVTVAIGSKKYSRAADSKGKFNVAIPRQKAGKKLIITSRDKAGNVSKARSVVVLDRTAPSLTLKPVSDKEKVITVKTEINAKVTVVIGKWSSKQIQAKANKEFRIAIPQQKAGTKVKVIAKDKAGNTTAKSVTVLDKTAPIVTIIPVTDQSKEVMIKTEPGAAIHVTIGSTNYTAKAVDTKGTFKAAIPQQKAGTKVMVIAKDKAGNTTAKSVTVLDKTAPAATIAPVTDQSKEVTIKTEPGAAVHVTIGTTNYPVKAVDTKGTFKAAISPQKAGIEIKVMVKDKANNPTVKSVTVTAASVPSKPTTEEHAN